MTAPSLVVIFELERAPRIEWRNVTNDGDRNRLVDWIAAHAGYGARLAAKVEEHASGPHSSGEAE